MTTDDNNEQSIRQRRNLVITAFIVIVYTLGDMAITGVNTRGLILTVGNPEIIPYVLGALLIYFTWRYSSVFYKEGSFQKVCATYHAYIDNILWKGEHMDKPEAYKASLRKFHSEVPRLYLLMLRIRAFIVLFFRQEFSEYIFPFFIALIAFFLMVTNTNG